MNPLSLPRKTRYAWLMADPLARIIEQLKAEPSRTGSIVITVFGDAIVPRGGSVWLGTLLEFFKSLDIEAGVVRTAMSRLAADGWLERRRSAATASIGWCRRGGKPSMPRPSISTIRSLRLDRAFRTAADRRWRGPRRFARGAEKCWLRQPAAGRLGRAIGRSDPRGSRIRDPAGGVGRGRQRPAIAQRKLAARSHRGRLPEIHENLRADARLDRPPRAHCRMPTPSPRGSC